MPLRLNRIARGWLFAFAMLAAGFAAARADEPRTSPTIEPIELEFHSADDPHLQNLKRSGQYPPPTFSTPGGLPPEILKIQQELGGSVVNQFSTLQSAEPAAGASSSPGNRAELVAALRAAAWSMDSWANRLEALEAYDEADALRAHAQRLRITARGSTTRPTCEPAHSPAPAASEPALQIEITPSPSDPAPTELR